METKLLKVSNTFIDFTKNKVSYIIVVEKKEYLLQNVNTYYLITKNNSYLFKVDTLNGFVWLSIQ